MTVTQDQLNELPNRNPDVVLQTDGQNGSIFQYIYINPYNGTQKSLVVSTIIDDSDFLAEYKLKPQRLADYLNSEDPLRLTSVETMSTEAENMVVGLT